MYYRGLNQIHVKEVKTGTGNIRTEARIFSTILRKNIPLRFVSYNTKSVDHNLDVYILLKDT